PRIPDEDGSGVAVSSRGRENQPRALLHAPEPGAALLVRSVPRVVRDRRPRTGAELQNDGEGGNGRRTQRRTGTERGQRDRDATRDRRVPEGTDALSRRQAERCDRIAGGVN